ncbi:MAG: DUF1559 domain-containing protein [Pirellulales bacterium]|nr:DUF1559 domain-containing protein [Pirellulales bacterium]
MNRKTAFTLIELLIVMAIIGILIALMMPALSSIREAGRKTQCRSHLKQISLACLQYEKARGHYPSGGWGWQWAGDPDRGFGKRQPGGWVYNILPFLDQELLHQLGAGESDAARATAAGKVSQTPLTVMNCPSRREAIAYVASYAGGTFHAHNADAVPSHARSDYAANGGDQGPLNFGGPSSFADGDNPAWTGWPSWQATQTGVIYLRSEVQHAHVRDGTGNTYMVAEKYLAPNNYTNGIDAADNTSMYQGHDWDVIRWASTSLPPYQDRFGLLVISNFGSPHSAGFHAAFCDGTIRTVSYEIDPAVHGYLAHRSDDEDIPEDSF